MVMLTNEISSRFGPCDYGMYDKMCRLMDDEICISLDSFLGVSLFTIAFDYIVK